MHTDLIPTGILLIILGLSILLVPIIEKQIETENIPSWLIYVHSFDGIYFATSPLLIFIMVVLVLMELLF